MKLIGEQPRGVGGWLILFIIGQLFVIVTSLFTLPQLRETLGGDSWALGDTFAYVRPMLVAESAMHLAQIVLPLAGLVLIARHHHVAPLYWRLYLGACLVYAVVDIAFSRTLTADLRPLLDAATIPEFESEMRKVNLQNGRVVIYAIIWITYWTVSQRVRNTFRAAEEAPAFDGAMTTSGFMRADDYFARQDRPQRPCPFCGGSIVVEAEFCRHCRNAVGANAEAAGAQT